MEFLKKVFFNILIGVLVIYIAILLVSPEVMMDVFGFRTFIVLTPSMEPVLNIEDMIITVRTDEDELEVGDIISFNAYIPALHSEQMITHYIGKIEDTSEGKVYYTRGTFMEEDEYDEWTDENGDPYLITYDEIEGRYLFKIPYVGYVNNLFSNQTMVLLIAVNGAIIYILVRYLRRDEDEDYDD